MIAIKRNGISGMVGVLAVVAMLLASGRVEAKTYSDRGAAVLIWPKVVVDSFDRNSVGVYRDTVIRVANLEDAGAGSQTALHCFYVNSNKHCSNTGRICTSSSDCGDISGFFGSCQADWLVTDFNIRLTPGQPLGWRASDGMHMLPLSDPYRQGGPRCAGTNFPCLNDVSCQLMTGNPASTCDGLSGSNAGSSIPPTPEDPFIGELKCVQVNPDTQLPNACSGGGGACAEFNDAMGTATLEAFSDGGVSDAESYNAVGVRTHADGAVDANGQLVLTFDSGGEYQPCPSVLVFNHFFDDAVDPVSGGTTRSELTLVPCGEDFVGTNDTRVGAQFLVYNEFEQVFSASKQVSCQVNSQISLIDTTQSSRSIFNAAVAGTLSGQTRIHGVGGGLTGVATMELVQGECLGSPPCVGAAYNLNQFGDRDVDDVLQIPE